MTRIVILFIALAPVLVPVASEEEHIMSWEAYKTKFNKTYDSTEEEARRRSNYDASVREIKDHNDKADQGMYSHKLGLGEYSDMTHEEFMQGKESCLSINATEMGQNEARQTDQESDQPEGDRIIPYTWDWRKFDLVTPVKDQGKCGSCYAFSAVGALEGQMGRYVHRPTSLSAQNIVDCSQPQGNKGCGGGWMTKSFDYVAFNGGININVAYPYTSGTSGKTGEKCKYSENNVRGETCHSHETIAYGNEEELKKACYREGPISVAVDPSQFKQHKISGIFDHPECRSDPSSLKHAMLVVGFGCEKGKDFWIVKNSWGKGWGENGYVRMVRNKNNQCGIATAASYPVCG